MSYSVLTDFSPKNTRISFWQSVYWRDILLGSHQAEEVFYFGNKDSYLLVEIRTIGVGQRAGFCLGVTLEQLGGESRGIFLALEDFLKKQGILYLQIEPLSDLSGAMVSTFREPYRSFLTPYTRQIDIGRSSETILSEMHEKGRYNIRLAERRGVTIESVLPTPENIDIWIHLLTETTDRDGFSQNSRKYYEVFLSTIDRDHLGGLSFAYFEGQVIAAGIFVFYGEMAIYYYGASRSDRELRKHMAPYLLQWHAIEAAQEKNLRIYDFLGVADPSNPHDSLRGVTDFKEKFGGQLVKLPKKYLIPLRGVKYQMFLLLRFLFSRKN